MAPRRSVLAIRLGRRIVVLRGELAMTQEQLAWSADLGSKGYLSRIESGQRLPSLAVMERLARSLQVEVRDLLLFPETSSMAMAMELMRQAGETGARSVIDFIGELGQVTPALRAAEPRGRVPTVRNRR